MGTKRSKAVKKRDQQKGSGKPGSRSQKVKAPPKEPMKATKPRLKFGSLAQLQKEARSEAALLARDAAMPKGDDLIKEATLVGADRERKFNHKSDASFRQFKSAIEEMILNSDVILQVLDARDPEACRNEAVERRIISMPGKKLIFVLNKIDLVPDEVIAAWSKYFNQIFPTVEFKAASTSGGRVAHLKCRTDQLKEADRQNPFRAAGVDRLLSKVLDGQKTATVGLLGMPNVGKSSIINSLSRARSVKTGQAPGVTTETTRIKLRDSLAIYDAPGVCNVESSHLLQPKSLVLSNAVSGKDYEENIAMVQLCLAKFDTEALLNHYDPQRRTCTCEAELWTSLDEFLAFVAKSKGLMSGPKPDKNAAAKEVVQDLRKNALKWYETPPQFRKKVEALNLMRRQNVVIEECEDSL